MIRSETRYEVCHDPDHGVDCVILRDGVIEVHHLPDSEARAIVERQSRLDAKFQARERERKKLEPPRDRIPLNYRPEFRRVPPAETSQSDSENLPVALAGSRD